MRLYAPEVYVETSDLAEAKRLFTALQATPNAKELADAWGSLRAVGGVYRMGVDAARLSILSAALRKARWTKAADLGDALASDIAPLVEPIPPLSDLI